MIEFAYKYENEINKEYLTFLKNDPDAKYINYTSYFKFELKIDGDQWNNIQFVSVYKKKIIAYFNFSVDRVVNNVDGIQVMRFNKNKKYNDIFLKDYQKTFDMLFNKYKFDNLFFSCVVGGSGERINDLMLKLNNKIRIVGIKKNYTKLNDGLIYDIKMYQVIK